MANVHGLLSAHMANVLYGLISIGHLLGGSSIASL